MCPSGNMVRPITAGNPDFRPAFEVIDVDRDGKISREDLREFCAGIPRSSADDYDEIIGTMMSVADENKDGFVEFDEFEKVLEGYSGKSTVSGESNGGGGLMEDVFKVMDRDGDGRLSYQDLKSYMDWAGFTSSDDEIKAMIRLASGNQNDGVSFEGLLKIFGC